jgi:hypothetical protein
MKGLIHNIEMALTVVGDQDLNAWGGGVVYRGVNGLSQ